MIPLFIGAAILYLMSQDRTVNRVREALDEWETEVDEDSTEADFRVELAEFLRDDDCYLIEESGLRRGRRDIWIKDINSDTEVVIELKLNLSSANEVRRLIGQIASYSEHAKAIFIVLIDPDRNMADELRISLEALQCKDIVEIVYFEEDDDEDDD
jgi:alpha-L-arabinofuranosidase